MDKRNQDAYNEEVLADVEGYILDRGGTLQEAANMTGLSCGRLSERMKKRGLVYDRRANKWTKPERKLVGFLPKDDDTIYLGNSDTAITTKWAPVPEGYKFDLQTGALYQHIPLTTGGTGNDPDLSNVQLVIDRAANTLFNAQAELENAVNERDRLRKDNAELTASLYELTKRHEDQGRKLMLAEQDAEKWRDEKRRQDKAKVIASQKKLDDLIERTEEWVNKARS